MKILLLLLIVTNCMENIVQPLEPLWQNLDQHFRQNIPNEELKGILKEAELEDVEVDGERVRFCYESRKGQVIISFNLDAEGEVTGVNGELVPPGGHAISE